MAVVNELTWNIVPNGLVTGDVTRAFGTDDLTDGWKQLWLDVNTQYKADGWTVKGTSDGVAGAMDGSDRWGGIADLRGADVSGGPLAHSWIVRERNGMHVLWSHGHSAGGTLPAQHIRMSVSSSPYVGGDASNDPTSPDEALLKSGTGFASNRWIEDGAGTANLRWHNWHSSINRQTRTAVYIGGTLRSISMFEELKNPPTGWATPWLIGIGTGSPANAYNKYWDTTESMWHTYHSGAALRALWSTMCIDFNGFAGPSGFVLSNRLPSAHTVSGEFAPFKYRIRADSGGVWGRLGEIYDLWNEANQADGTSYPSDPGDQVHIGDHWVLPSDGVTTFLTS